MIREIYLDNAATSFPKAEGVSDAMKAYLDTVGVNVGRGSYARCMDSGMTVLSVRESVAAAFGCTDARRVIFTAGCTAALNMAINGFVREGDTVLISSMEHNAVIGQREVICDRPFAYAIVDVETGLPIFFGTVEHVK